MENNCQNLTDSICQIGSHLLAFNKSVNEKNPHDAKAEKGKIEILLNKLNHLLPWRHISQVHESEREFPGEFKETLEMMKTPPDFFAISPDGNRVFIPETMAMVTMIDIADLSESRGFILKFPDWQSDIGAVINQISVARNERFAEINFCYTEGNELKHGYTRYDFEDHVVRANSMNVNSEFSVNDSEGNPLFGFSNSIVSADGTAKDLNLNQITGLRFSPSGEYLIVSGIRFGTTESKPVYLFLDKQTLCGEMLSFERCCVHHQEDIVGLVMARANGILIQKIAADLPEKFIEFSFHPIQVCFDWEGKNILAADHKGMIHVVSIKSQKEIAKIQTGFDGRIAAMDVMRDNKIVVGFWEGDNQKVVILGKEKNEM